MQIRNSLTVIVFVIITACGRNSYKANISGIDIEIGISRLEQDLFSIDPARIADSTDYLNSKYGKFLRYFSYVINIGEVGDSAWKSGLVRFCTDKLNNEVFAAIGALFPDTRELESGLTDAFRHYRYYFPGKEIPAIYTCITGFNNSIITGDSALGIGLDRYLGSDSKYYPMLMLYKYQTERMNPENIIPDCLYGWAASEWIYDSTGYETNDLLTSMIHEGKLWYFTRCMLPETDEELIYGFNAGKLSFCRENEGRMWQYLVENNLVFSTDQLTLRKLTGEAAFTTYFSAESPGRAALWLGFRIVESYMSRNRNVSLEELMKETDIQMILEKAKYRPPVK